MPQNIPISPDRARSTSVAAGLLATLCAVASLFAAGGATAAHAQRNRRPTSQGAPTEAAAQNQTPRRPKAKLTPLRTSETPQGSRLTITSTSALSDYSAYRSGDKFYVVIPNADAGAVGGGGARGRGFEGADVQKRGDDVVLSFKLKPGAKPRVNQRFNQLDVVFAAPEGNDATQSSASGNTSRPQASETQNTAKTPAARPQPQQNVQTTTQRTAPAEDARSTAANRAQVSPVAPPPSTSASTQPPIDINSLQPAGPASAASTEAAPAAVPAATETQVAQAAPPAGAGAPTKITADPGSAQPATSIAAAILGNWPLVLIATLLLVGLGLFFAARRSSSDRQAPAAPTRFEEPTINAVEEKPAPALKAFTTPPAPRAVPPPAPMPVTPPAMVEAKPTIETAPAATEVFAPAAAVTAGEPARKSTKTERKKKKRGKKGTAVVAEAPVIVQQLKEETAAQEAPEDTPVAERTVEAWSPAEETTAPVEEARVEETQVEEEARVEEWGGQESIEAAPPEVFAPVAAVPPVNEVVTPTAEETTVEETAVEETSVEEPAAEEAIYEEPADDELPAVAEAQPAAEAEAAEEIWPAEEAEPVAVAQLSEETQTVAESLPVAEASAAIEPVADEPLADESEPTEIEPAAAALDPDAVQAETRRLLDGEQYDRNLAAVSDPMMRQMIAAELLAALAGRNAERRARAHTAFVEHGFFNESADSLRHAEAPVERASAARALGLAGDRLATPLLIDALEDSAMEVRRAAVEALASVRDPRAIGPLRALLEREKRERIKVPRRLIEHAVEVCAEAPEEVAHTPAEDAAAASLVAAPEAFAAEETRAEFEEALNEEPAFTEAEEPPTLVVSDETVSEEVAPTEALAPPAPAAEPEETSALAETPEAAYQESFEAPVAEESFAPVEETYAPFEETQTAVEEETQPASFETVEAPAFEEPALSEEAEPRRQSVEIEARSEVAEVATQTEEPATAIETYAPTEEAEPAPQSELEFETHRAESVAETSITPVESFEPTHQETGAVAEDWIELEVEDVRVDFGAASEAASSRAVVPFEQAEVEEESAPTTAVEEFTAALRSAPPAVSEIEPASSGRVPETAGSKPDKGIAPFVEDDMSAVPKAIQVRLSSDEPEERATAIKDLARVGSDDAFQVICAGFDDPSFEVRAAAARSLYQLQEDRAEAFTRALREADSQRRRQIGAAIASSGLAAEALSHLTGESRERTYDAFSLLFLMAKAGEVQPLIRAIEAHPDVEVRLAVVKLLALSGQREILPAFRRLAVRGTLPAEVRSAVMEAIYQISSSSQPTTTA